MRHDEAAETPATDAPSAARGRRTEAIIGAIVGGLVVLFAVLNSQSVEMDWIVSTTKTPLIVVIVLFTLLGFAAGRFGGRSRRR
jgi:uncharacterized integral membrane protein